MKIKKFFIPIGIVLIIIIGGYFAYDEVLDKDKDKSVVFFDDDEEDNKECGEISKDTTWFGEVQVECNAFVEPGVTLTIEPGTVVKFKHDRNYETFYRAGLSTDGGTIIAKGTPNEQIWFTSDAEEPINGDWNGIALENTDDSVFDYTIVEYGEMGIEQFDSKVPVTNSIIRWSNAEGLYAERSEPYFAFNTLYGNGYHDIALEQYNTNVQILNNYFHDSNYAIHHEETVSHIEGNYFENYTNKEWVITAGMESQVTLINNKFENVPVEEPVWIDGEESGTTYVMEGNDFGDGSVQPPIFDYQDIKKTELGYIPGDPEDMFPYIYAAEDETRRVVQTLGEGQGFGWSLTYADGYIWRFDGNFLRVNPVTGETEHFFNEQSEIMNPRGLTWDGEYFWVNDFSLQRISKFTIDGDRIKILEQFDIPDKEIGGSNGLASDGEYLYYRSRTGQVVQLDKLGNEIKRMEIGAGSLVWTGKYFWTTGGCSKGLCKYTKDGKLVGEIYNAAKDPWAIAWDGEYIWTVQRTCEMWNDNKIYQIEIKDDTVGEQ
ncbi:MAG: right-handed parallel beta-helix repeat-containing protein [Patescibacteria group bacterium]